MSEKKWIGDLDDDCSLTDGDYTAVAEAMDEDDSEWHAGVYYKGESIFHWAEDNIHPLGGVAARDLCELVIDAHRSSVLRAEVDRLCEINDQLRAVMDVTEAHATAAESECERLRGRAKAWKAGAVWFRGLYLAWRKDGLASDARATAAESAVEEARGKIERLKQLLEKQCLNNAKAGMEHHELESQYASLRARVEVIARASEKAFVSNRKKNPDYVYTGLEADMAMVDAELALLRALLAKGGE